MVQSLLELKRERVIAGRYRLIERLGSGGFSEVWYAEQLYSGAEQNPDVIQSVALKLIPLAEGSDGHVRGQLNEVFALRDLHCDALVPIYDAGVAEGVAYIAMQRLTGYTLASYLRYGKLHFRRALVIALEIARALDVCHASGVVHADLKPENVFLHYESEDVEPRVRVLDFGIARAQTREVEVVLARSSTIREADDTDLETELVEVEGPAEREPARVFGTPGYIAPECLSGQTPTAESDAFALGAILFRMLAGRMPQRVPEDAFAELAASPSRESARELYRLLSAHTLRGDLIGVAELCPELPPGVAELVDKLLSADPSARLPRSSLFDAVETAFQFPYGIPDPPYAGLEAFDVTRASYLCGRDADVQNILVELETRTLLTLTGPSGCGKSSLAIAGIGSALDSALFCGTDGWNVHGYRPRSWPALETEDDPEQAAGSIEEEAAADRSSVAGPADGRPSGIGPVFRRGGSPNEEARGWSALPPRAPTPTSLTPSPQAPDTGSFGVRTPAGGRATPRSMLSMSRTSLPPRSRTSAAPAGSAFTEVRSPARSVGTLIVVDQIEELLDLGLPARRAICAQIVALAEGRTRAVPRALRPPGPYRVIVTVRDDLFGRVAALAELERVLERHVYVVRGVDPNAVLAIIATPVHSLGYAIEGLEIVADEARRLLGTTPAALPLLQFALSQFWERRDEQRKLLGFASWQALGGVSGALAHVASNLYASLDDEERVMMRAWIVALFNPSGRRESVSLSGRIDIARLRVLKRLIDHRLVRKVTGAVAGVEIIHESLAQHEPIRSWLAETHRDRALLVELEQEAERWLEARHSSDLCWRGDRLRAGRTLVTAAPLKALDVSEFARLFLRRSQRSQFVRRAVVAVAVVGGLVLAVLGVAYARVVSEARAERDRIAAQADLELARARDVLSTVEHAESANEDLRRNLTLQQAMLGQAVYSVEQRKVDKLELKELLEQIIAQAETADQASRRAGAAFDRAKRAVDCRCLPGDPYCECQ